MADLASTRIFGKLTVMHEAIVKANAEIAGNITASKFIGDGSQLTALPWGELTGKPAQATRWPSWSEVSSKPTTFTPSAHTHSLSQITDAGSVASLNTNASTANFLRGDGTWVTPPNTNTTYSEITTAEIDAGTASTSRTITGRRMKYALDKKANTSTQVIAGTGLSGGGTLAANRTLSVSYGTAAGTAAQGNDSRLSNSREWTAGTISQAEAEAGTATTRRAFTAQRVRQAANSSIAAKSGRVDGIASLDGNGKIPLSQLSDSIIGQVEYMGLWTASTNTPTLPTTPTEKGHYYVVSVSGTQFGLSFEVGDWIISNGASWDKVDNTDAVSSVNGRTGNVSGLAESTDTRFTDSREWTGSTISQAEAEAGTATTRRAFTAQRVRQAIVAWAPTTATRWPTFAEVTGKPSTYAPSSHTHPWSQVTGQPATATRWPTWAEVTSKPTTFAPSAHTHSYLPLSGGTLTGQLRLGSNDGSNWMGGTSGTSAAIRYNTAAASASSWHAWIAGRDSGNNGWAIGTLGTTFSVSYATASNISAGNNTTTQVLSITPSQVSVTGNFIASGNVTAYSDIKLKEDIEVIPDALSKINTLHGYTYKRKDIEDGTRHTGVIAQEVQKVLPEAVMEDEDGTLSVAYGNMVGLLIEAIKELKAEVDRLKVNHKEDT